MDRLSKPKTTMDKLIVVRRYVKNWTMLLSDKFFGGKNIVYHFHNGVNVECRTKSTDVNEAVVVLSGIEYPKNLCEFDSKKLAIVFDIGANIGAFSLYINSLNPSGNCRIYAFEPSPDNVALCRSNLDRNGMKNVELIDKAISGHDGHANFNTSGGFDAFRIDEKTEDGIKVSTVKLSTFCHNNSIEFINLLKMDIEGGEVDVFNNDINFIIKHVKIIFMEFHESRQSENVQNMIGLLQSDFSIEFENVHENGGMLIAERKRKQ